MIGIRSHFVLLAPNLYSDRTLIRLDLKWDEAFSIDELKAVSLGELDLEADLIVQPGLPGLVAGIATWLQRQAGHLVSPVSPGTELGLAQTALFEWEDALSGEHAGRAAVELCGRMARKQPREQLDRVIRRFNRHAMARCLAPGLRVLLAAAKRRDVPVIRLQQPPFQAPGTPGVAEVVQLGWGDRQVRCRGLLTDRVPKEAIAVCSDPTRLSAVLAAAGLACDLKAWTPGAGNIRIIYLGEHIVAAFEPETGRVLNPDTHVVEVARRVAEAIELPVAAVDLIVTADGVVISKVDPQPSLDGLPGEIAMDVAEAFVQWLYPDGQSARIPLALVTGTNGKTTTCHLLANILKAMGNTVGLVCSTGAYLDGERVKKGDLSSPWEGLEVLHGRRVSAAVMEVARGGLLKVGLGVTGAAAGGCLRIAADHFGLQGIDDETGMAQVKALVLEGVDGPVVLSADSEWSLGMAAKAGERELILVTTSRDPEELLDAHPGARRVVHLRDATGAAVIAVTDRDGCTDLIGVAEVPVTRDGQVDYNVENAAFAAAFALAMGCSHDAIREGLGSFVLEWQAVPGRLSVVTKHPFTVILDYAHNPAGVRALHAYLKRAFDGVRLVGVITASDRRIDEEVKDYARACAEVFDEFVCTEYDPVINRAAGAGTALLPGVLEQAGIDPEHIHVQPVPDEAARLAMDLARPGDAVIMLGRDDDRVWEIVEKYPAAL